MRFRSPAVLKALSVVSFLLICSLNVAAQTPNLRVPRIQAAVDENSLTTLHGNTHPLAQPKYDKGVAPDALPMERMLMVLQRSPQQEAALRTLVDQQQTKSSSNYHQWLTPEQFGEQYGVADSDVQTVTAWLQSHGFQVNRVATGKMLIEFSGTAGAIRNAFHTEIHSYIVNGEQHWANSSDPQIPSALAPVIAGVNTMHNFRKKSMISKAKTVPMPPVPSKGAPQITIANCPNPNINFGNTCFGLGPADFATIYNIPPAATGAGQTIALVGDSDVCTGSPLPAGCTVDDVLAFRTLFGLPGNNTQVIVDGIDPGLNGDELEADLDVQWSGAVAPSATILFVTAANTESSSGIDLAAEHIVDGNLAPVLSESFGQCEPALGQAGNQFFSTLWEQAAAQGITVIISAGDSGSAGCDNPDQEGAAVEGVFVNGIASTPFDTAMGGTDFDYNATGYPGAFWNTTPTNLTTTPTGLSAKSYIPETTWNDTCAQSVFSDCNLIPAGKPFLQSISAGGGGQSNCVVVVSGLCEEAYAKPPWQVATGVPNDSVRDIPDAALFSAPGEVSNSFYLVCSADLDPGVPSCTGAAGSTFQAVGGTSAAAPTFAGIMSLVNQAMVAASQSPRQGLANYVLYPLFATQSGLNCDSSTIPAAGCIFNDIVKGTNSVACVAGTQNCNATSLSLVTLDSSGNPTTTPAFATTAGYDLATGLGSINVGNLITGWVGTHFTPTTTTFCLSKTATTVTNCSTAINIVHGTQVFVNAAVTASPSGDVSLIGHGTFPPSTIPGTAGVDHFDAATGNSDIYSLTAGVTPSGASTFELVGGTYTVTAHFPGNNGGTGVLYGASDSAAPGVSVTVTPEASTTTLTVLETNVVAGTITVLGASSSVPYGSPLTVRTDIVSTATHNGSQLETGTGSVNITDGGTSVGSFPLNSDGFTDFNSPSFSFPGEAPAVTTIPALTPGSHSFKASYAGDPSYTASSTASAFPLTITQAQTFSTISGSASETANSAFNLTVLVDTAPASLATPGSFGNAPTGTVTFFNGATQIGNPVTVAATTDGFGFVAAQAVGSITLPSSASITAKYSGDTNYSASTSTAFAVTVTGGPALTIAKTHSGNFQQGQVGATYTITVTNSGTAATSGTVTMVDTIPSGLTLTALAGTGWTCTVGNATCTRADALAASTPYPAITATVTVAANASASVTNMVTVTGGGATNTNNTASDVTTITAVGPNLTITKMHTGNFSQGQVGATYTILVTNSGNASTSGAVVTMVDTIPTGLTLTALTGTGWTCTVSTATCTRSDVLAATASYPAITATVTVSQTAAASVTNKAVVSGGGEATGTVNTASDVTTIVQFPDLTVVKMHSGNFFQGQVGAQYTIVVSNVGNAPVNAQVNMVDTVPTGLTPTAIAGTGWTCLLATVTCTRTDVLAAGASFPAITLTVSVASSAPALVTNMAVVSGGGEINTSNDTAADATTIQTPPTATLSTNTVTFPAQDAGVASTAMTVTVTNSGGAPLQFTAIAFTTIVPDFVIANSSTCIVGTPVAGSGGSCNLNLTFTPAQAGARGPATLKFTDDAASATQTVTINGTGVDFSVSGQAATVTEPAGTPAMFSVGVTPLTGGFPNSISFTASGLPGDSTASFNPPSVTPGATATSTTMTITTTTRTAVMPRPGHRMPVGPLPLTLWSIAAAMLAASLALMRMKIWRQKMAWAGMTAAAVLILVGVAGCNSTPAVTGTPAGTFTITVTATSGSLSHNTTVTLTVQ